MPVLSLINYGGGIFCPKLRLTSKGSEKFAFFSASVNITFALTFFNVLFVIVVASLDWPEVELIIKPFANEEIFINLPLGA